MDKVIGIDVSKATLDGCFIEVSKKESFVVTNNQKGFKKIALKAKGALVVMEASGPYYLQLSNYLYTHGIEVSVVNPLVIKRFSQMNLQRAKTDKKDAETIANYGRIYDPKRWSPNSKNTNSIRQLHSAIELLDKQIRQLKGQQEAFDNSGELVCLLKKELKSMLNFLVKKKLKLSVEVERLAEQEFGDKINKITSIPGIGKKTAIMLNVITDGFTKFEHHKQLTAYIGFSPRVYQSGTSVKGKGHICKMGNSQIRKLLYLCSWTAKFCNKACREMYERLKAKGKPERVIKIAIANKLLKQAFAIGKSKMNYSENHVDNICF